MGAKRPKAGLPAVDNCLEDVWRRLDALERRTKVPSTEALIQQIVNIDSSVLNQYINDLVLNEFNIGGAAFLLFNVSAASLGTGTARRWLSNGTGTAGTTVAGAAFYCVPDGFSRATGLSLAMAGGSPGTTNQTVIVTLGDATTESDTALTLTVPVNLSGTATATVSGVTVTPGQAIRVATTRSVAGGTAPGFNVLVTLER